MPKACGQYGDKDMTSRSLGKGWARLTKNRRTLDTADWKVSCVIGDWVLLEILDRMRSTVSDSRDMVNTICTLVLVTVISFEVSGTADVNVHSSSSFAAEADVLLCTRFDDGAGLPTPRRSIPAEVLPVFCGLMDC
jgi:hypothetical protein